MPKTSAELLHRAQFTKLMVNIQNDIKKLESLWGGRQLAHNFGIQLNKYIESNRSLKDYLYFREQALQIRDNYLENRSDKNTKHIVYNIILGILGLGVVYGLAVGMNYLLTGNTLFFKSEAVSKVEAVFNDVDALKHNAFTVVV